MPSTDAFFAFSLFSFLLIVVPGPSVLFTVSRALTVGRRRLALLGGTGGLVMIGLGVKVAFTNRTD